MSFFSGFIGFLFGFYAGLLILKVRLRDKTREELMTDKTLWWRNGWIVWATALFGVWLGLKSYAFWMA